MATREYYEAHKKEYAENNRRYQIEHPEQTTAKRRKWQSLHRDKSIEASKKWRESNKEKFKEIKRKYRATNSDKIRAYDAKWRSENQDKTKIYGSNRRAIENGASGKHTASDIRAMLISQHRKCYYCKQPLTKYHIEHVVPLSRGGTNGPSNIVLACPKCNLSKHDMMPHEWSLGGRLL